MTAKGEPRNSDRGRYAAIGMNDLDRFYVQLTSGQWKTLNALTPPECRSVAESCLEKGSQGKLHSRLLGDIDVWDEYQRWYIFDELVRLKLLTVAVAPDGSKDTNAKPKKPNDVLGIAEVAKMLGVSIKSVRDHAQQGDLYGNQGGDRKWRFKRRDVEAYRDRALTVVGKGA